MPSNLTHLLQPLDVCVFQPYKHYHGLALDRLVRDGAIEITKLDFLSITEEVRSKPSNSQLSRQPSRSQEFILLTAPLL
jgi:hypothetical protein